MQQGHDNIGSAAYDSTIIGSNNYDGKKSDLVRNEAKQRDVVKIMSRMTLLTIISLMTRQNSRIS